MSREKRRIRQHIENLNSPDKEVSARAEGYLLRYYGARALDELIEACSHTNPVVRYRAVWVLGDTQDPRAYDTILRLIDDPEDRVRYDATIALGILGDMRAVEPLIHLLPSTACARYTAALESAPSGKNVIPDGRIP